MVLKRYPEMLFLAEVPYTFGSDHPHAVGHTYGAAMLPEAVAYADIVMFRTVGNNFTAPEQAACRKLLAQGKAVILSHRTYEAQSFTYPDAAQIIAGQAASFANGLGYYSWNEMVDTHIAQRPDTEQMITAITAINREYQQRCRGASKPLSN